MRVNGQVERANELEAEVRGRSAARRSGTRNCKIGSNIFSNNDDPATFCMSNACFSSAPHDKPSGIVDTGALRTLIDEDTLLAFMTAMNLNLVNVIPGLTPPARCFGVNGPPPISTSFRATLPWQVWADTVWVTFGDEVIINLEQHEQQAGRRQ